MWLPVRHRRSDAVPAMMLAGVGFFLGRTLSPGTAPLIEQGAQYH